MDSRTLPSPAPDGRTRLLWTGLVVLLAVAVISGGWAAFSGRSRLTKAGHAGAAHAESSGVDAASPGVLAQGGTNEILPPGDPLPAFSLTERGGRTVSLADLEGKVWVADFIFTRCPNVCPELSRKMRDVRRRLEEAGAGDVVSVSFTVDPVHDTPKALAEYARNFGADPSSWLFLTGPPKDVLHTVKDGFQLAMADPAEGPPAHSNRFVVVDAKGRIRSTHLGTEEGVVDRIVGDALVLRREASL